MILMIFVFDNLGYVEKMFFTFLSFLNGYESKMECCQGLLFDSCLELLPPVSSCLNSAYGFQNYANNCMSSLDCCLNYAKSCLSSLNSCSDPGLKAEDLVGSLNIFADSLISDNRLVDSLYTDVGRMLIVGGGLACSDSTNIQFWTFWDFSFDIFSVGLWTVNLIFYKWQVDRVDIFLK